MPEVITMKTEELLQFLLVPSEQLVLAGQGACKTSDRSGWKLGRMVLTDERFVFVAGSHRLVAQVLLHNVRQVSVEKHPFILGRRPAVRLTWSVTPTRQLAPSRRALWVITGDARTWAEALFQMTRLEVTGQAIERVASAVDQDGGMLLWYVWHQRHAGTDELAELIDAPSQRDVLVKIRETINPAAVKLLGCNILVFRHRWKECGNFEPINSRWWIAGKRRTVSTTSVARVSVFEEPDHVDVVTDLPGVKDNDVMLNVCNDRLVISAASDAKRFHEETALPTGTCTRTMTSRMNNGVLLVRFRRLLPQQTAQSGHERTFE